MSTNEPEEPPRPSIAFPERKRLRTQSDDYEDATDDPLAILVRNLQDSMALLQAEVRSVNDRVKCLESENETLRSQISMLSSLPQAAPSSPSSPMLIDPPSQSSTVPSSMSEGNDLARSIVMCNLDESQFNDGYDRVQDDYTRVCKILSLIGVPCLPLAVYRMPLDDRKYIPGKDRLVKIVVPTSGHQKLILKNAHFLSRSTIPVVYRDIFIRPSYANREDRPPNRPRRFRPPHSVRPQPIPIFDLPSYVPSRPRLSSYRPSPFDAPFSTMYSSNCSVPHSSINPVPLMSLQPPPQPAQPSSLGFPPPLQNTTHFPPLPYRGNF